MKYITQDWTSTKDGYLFFVQRLQEMLFHYSDDIVKAPVHNTQTLLEEYVDTEKDVVKGSIKQYQLDIIAKEIKSSLMTDVIVRELYKYEVIEEMAKFLDKDQRTAVHYIFNKIPKKKYYEICCKYLKENLSESNRKTEIEKGLRAWLAFLLWHGYSSEYIYRFLRNIFEESINDPEKKAQIFLNRFDFEIGKYKVYFVFYEKLKPYQKLLNERLHISFEDDGCFKQIKRKQKSFIGVMETKAYDNYSAMKRAYSALEIFLRYLEVFLNDNISVIGKNGLVIRQDTQEGIILPVKALYRLRNAIVHAGESHKRIQMLGEHLHIYVDRVILELMVKLAKDKCLGTIQDVFTDTYLLLNKKKKNLKEPGNVDEQSIMLLLENFFIEE